ncbi:group 3 secretory phospholipase A2-like [Conger conger]|uniref:group 3 secretory phospholipase A2-like n=1 Tax=Conger conger TaxID=82655 RepID=UPI002A5A4D36|nr:group 3 secretory phospholipase A2-like [Conger conger]
MAAVHHPRAGSATFCYWTRSAAEGRSHYSFLRQPANARPWSIRLYHSVWTRDRRLVDCAVTDEPAVTERYLSLCRGEQATNFTDVLETRFDVSLLFAPDNPCAYPFPAGVQASKRTKRAITDPVLAERHTGDSSEVKHRRQKRAWIIPGTVWCGSGNKADNYDDLGIFTQTDKCCREHDYCANTIPSFRFGYGVFNRHIFTVLHCDCEERFRQCLLTANDRVSNMVGYGYFNLLKTPCFTFTEKMQCIQSNWFGMCTLSEMSPFAVLQDAMDFNSTQPTSAATPGTWHDTSDPASPMPTPIRNVTRDPVYTTPPPIWKITSDSVYTTPTPIRNVTRDSVYTTPTPIRNVTRDSVYTTPTPIQNVTRDSVYTTPAPIRNVTRDSVYTTPAPIRNVTRDSVYTTPTPIRNIARDSVYTTPTPVRNIERDSVYTTPTPIQNVTRDSVYTTPTPVRNIERDSVYTTPTPVRKITSHSVPPTPTPVGNATSSTAGIRLPPARRPKQRLPCRPKGPAKGTASRAGRRKGVRRPVCKEQPNSRLPAKGQDSDAQLTADSAAGRDPADPPHQRVDPRSENALPSTRPRTPQPAPHKHPALMEDARKTETQQPCDCYKHLDECRLKIPPLGERFGLKNPERKTLYHCNCTNRLAQQLQDQEEPDGVQSLLVDFVSLSCFQLPPPEECPGTAKGCPAVLSEASHLQLTLSQRENGEAGIHPERPILKVKRHNSRESKRKQSPVKLYKKCLKIMDSKTSKRAEG